MPTPGISTSTTSPAASAADAGRRPGGDQVARLQRHDGADVRHAAAEWKRSCRSTAPRWRSAPLTRVTTDRRAPVERATTRGPAGQKVSNPLARVHWPSVFCRSRHGHVVDAGEAGDERLGVRLRHPIAPACRSRRRSRPRTRPASRPAAGRSCLPAPRSELGGLRKISGSFGTSLPSSFACSA